MSWRWTVIEENEFAVLYDAFTYWIVEDKTTRNKPVKFTGETKTQKNIAIDFAQDSNGMTIFLRAYYPKDQVEFQLVKRAFERLTQDRERQRRRLKELQT
jgi:pyoverdine/dityrosine biosynthesis protein Dit1